MVWLCSVVAAPFIDCLLQELITAAAILPKIIKPLNDQRARFAETLENTNYLVKPGPETETTHSKFG
jgi:hypothetical protein